MLKIVFAVQIAVAAAFGLSASTSTSSSTPTEQGASAPVVGRVSCSVCAENYDYCISDGGLPASCQREAAFCYKNCTR